MSQLSLKFGSFSGSPQINEDALYYIFLIIKTKRKYAHLIGIKACDSTEQ